MGKKKLCRGGSSGSAERQLAVFPIREASPHTNDSLPVSVRFPENCRDKKVTFFFPRVGMDVSQLLGKGKEQLSAVHRQGRGLWQELQQV